MLLFGGFGIFAKRYRVTYDHKPSYERAGDSYRAGARVKLIYPYLATDTDYTFTVTGADGTQIKQEPSRAGEIIFRMPHQDVRVETAAVNSMLPRE